MQPEIVTFHPIDKRFVINDSIISVQGKPSTFVCVVRQTSHRVAQMSKETTAASINDEVATRRQWTYIGHRYIGRVVLSSLIS